MPVYVDQLLFSGGKNAPPCFRGRASCHMYADTLDELHHMAKCIGLRRTWFQNHPIVKHYDLTRYSRELAVKFGAVEHNKNEAVRKWREIRGQV